VPVKIISGEMTYSIGGARFYNLGGLIFCLNVGGLDPLVPDYTIIHTKIYFGGKSGELSPLAHDKRRLCYRH